MPLTARCTSYTSKKGEVVERLGAFIKEVDLLGLIMLDREAQAAEGQPIAVHFAPAADGNMRVVRLPESNL